MHVFRLLLVLGLLSDLPVLLRAESLPNTKPLQAEDDLAAKMVAGIDQYLMRELAASVEKRKQYWKPDFSSTENYTKSVQPNRDRLRKIIGAVDPRLPAEMHYVATTDTPALVAETERYKVYAVRWPVFEGVDGEGLLLEPKEKAIANVVAIPDADQTPEMLVGLTEGMPKDSQFARRLADNNCRVIVPVLIDRQDTWSGNPRIRMTNQPHREFIYRMAFEMGRHIIGYEVQKVLAGVDWFCREKGHAPVGVFGYGEGGLLALCSAAIDERISSTVVSGYFSPRQEVWKEPIYRNVWAQLTQFGDGELIQLVMPRALIVEYSNLKVSDPPAPRENRRGAAPGVIGMPSWMAVNDEIARIMKEIPAREQFKRRGIAVRFGFSSKLDKVEKPKVMDPGFTTTFTDFLQELADGKINDADLPSATDARKNFDPAARQKRQFEQLVNFTQKLLRDSEVVREKFCWSKLDLSSVEKYEKSTEPLRKYLAEEVIGQLPAPTEPMNPRTREVYDEPKWKGYEVTLDLYPDVFAYGVLLVPKDLKPGEKRPVVVCQHGLEGRPQDVVNPKMKTRAYHSYGAQLADLGYIVYAPQNPYIGKDDFRVLQRKANPLKLSLFSFIVRQHERTLDWLETLPFVDKGKIALYGLSYGGKTAMRVPALEKRYCLSICSGDFNEWIEKMISVERRVSYMFTHEYEMYEFDLGHTFNYAEMTALIAPRPFMVERGHDDGVGIDEMVAYEYAKVRRLYSRLKLPERTEIEFFDGGHVIHGQGTFAFLKKHLHWPK